MKNEIKKEDEVTEKINDIINAMGDDKKNKNLPYIIGGALLLLVLVVVSVVMSKNKSKP